jgi:thermostable 8-oxoguanine DNA glycosylase
MHSFDGPSTQQVSAYLKGELVHLKLPAAERRVVGHDLLWGGVEEIGSPAYWTAQAWMWELEEPDHYRLGRSLREEVLACLLGGYGIPAEVGLAAFERLKGFSAADLHNESFVRTALAEPLSVRGRSVRYRFVQQKARHVALSMVGIEQINTQVSDRELRDALICLSGIGPKTASWIVRNWRGSDHVSILDVHIVRACRALGVFKSSWRVERHYALMEEAYLSFARAVGARASILDSVMWMTMRRLPTSVVVAMGSSTTRSNDHGHPKPVDIKQLILL